MLLLLLNEKGLMFLNVSIFVEFVYVLLMLENDTSENVKFF